MWAYPMVGWLSHRRDFEQLKQQSWFAAGVALALTLSVSVTVQAQSGQPRSLATASTPVASSVSSGAATPSVSPHAASSASSTTTAKATAASTAAAPSASAAPAAPSATWKERWTKLTAGALGLVFDTWPSPLFEANLWNTTLAGIRVALPLLLASLLLGAWLVERAHGRVPAKLVRQVAWVLTVGGLVVYYGGGNPNVRHPGFYQPQAYYHGYLGEKYREELEASSLVECTLAAEKALGKAQGHAQRYVYAQPEDLAPVLATSVPAASDPTVCSKNFTDERWQAFRKDIEWFLSAVKAEEWARLQRTRPELVSPTWRLFVSPLVSAPASEARFRVLAFAEPVLHFAALLAVGSGFGPVTAAALSITWACQPFSAFAGGATLLGDLWIVSWLIGLSLWRKAATRGSSQTWRAAGAGLAIGSAIALQPLCMLVLFPLAAVARGRMRLHSRLRYAGVALGLTLLAVGSCSAGFGGWTRYGEQLAQRREAPALTDTGLPALLSNYGAARYRFQRSDTAPDPATEWAALRGPEHRSKGALEVIAIGALVGLACFLAWRTRSIEQALLLGLSISALVTQPANQNIGLLGLCLLCARRQELALSLLTALAGCALLTNQTVFADDRAAALTALLWIATTTTLLALSWSSRKPGSAATTPAVAPTPAA